MVSKGNLLKSRIIYVGGGVKIVDAFYLLIFLTFFIKFCFLLPAIFLRSFFYVALPLFSPACLVEFLL